MNVQLLNRLFSKGLRKVYSNNPASGILRYLTGLSDVLARLLS